MLWFPNWVCFVLGLTSHTYGFMHRVNALNISLNAFVLMFQANMGEGITPPHGGRARLLNKNAWISTPIRFLLSNSTT